jgi:hypothetical protein
MREFLFAFILAGVIAFICFRLYPDLLPFIANRFPGFNLITGQ